ncbi:DASH family cryptochrome [Rhodohalobacter sp. SW132]|uniref:DASH family cryptochrome n=1 Tax=Rhodohalobacter sp. SW132 TaxID=2293433 RepID=UPI000E21D9C5|nr:DASH family cryptochrome [Rhodohalobacter sp. SW132]REL33416.1 DASH family cryptochrome [Rhodohalobacter sp. SW132]
MKSIVWLRNDLRLTDHQPLKAAAETGEVLPVYCFDPRHFSKTRYGFPKTDSLRAQFLIESVEDLRNRIRENGGELIVRCGKPEEILQGIVLETGAGQLLYHGEVTQEEKDVEARVEESLEIPFKRYWDNTMYHRDDLPFSLFSIPDVFTQFRKKTENQSLVREPVNVPAKFKTPDEVEPGKIPAIQDLGLEPAEPDGRAVLQFKGGESAAWERLNHYFFEADKLRDYKFTRNGLLGADYSSKFSPWLAHGCISARSIHAEVEKYETDVHENVSTYWMKFELIWRDYFRFSAVKYGSQIFKLGGIQEKVLDKEKDHDIFERWASGTTGIPFVDANMRELNATGYMSNRGRQNAASFLAQNLNFDWRRGAAWFESKLIDYDVCSNWGNWAYNATVGHDPRNRYFNIINQAQKYDKKGEYVRLWIPELKNLPSEFVHQPWKMTPDQQKLYETEIGRDYPEPMIDLEKSYEEIKARD